MKPTLEKLLSRAVWRGACLEWAGSRQPLRKGHGKAGYGRLTYRESGRQRFAQPHRLVYELAIGPIPEGLTIDHLCNNPPCINVDHLRVVSVSTNIMRGNGFGAINARKGSCHNGHAFTPENTYHYRGTRCCRACNRAAVTRYKARKQATR